MILTGDYHWGDIKALLPGADTPYAEWYSSEDNEYPVYQVRFPGVDVVLRIRGTPRAAAFFASESRVTTL